MAAFNAADTLDDCLASVLKQSYSDFEVILVNDGSSDSTSLVAERWARENPERLIFIDKQSNDGLGYCMNLATGKATGELLCRMDADDIMHHDRLSIQVDYIKSNALDACGCQLAYFSQVVDGCAFGVLESRRLPSDGSAIKDVILSGGHAISHPCLMLKRDLMDKVGGYRIMGPGQDWDLFIRLSEFGRVGNVESILHFMRIDLSNTSYLHAPKSKYAHRHAILNYRNRRCGNPEIPYSDFVDDLSSYISRIELVRLRFEAVGEKHYKNSIYYRLQGRAFMARWSLLLAAIYAPKKCVSAMRKLFG
jgi:glycosyltransferase involved in cell wall biosynthesis